jgi:xanthine dehydrogenase accessory protein XdhC
VTRLWAGVRDAIAANGRVAMVTVVAARGSTPRDAGARLVVRPDGAFTGTIGGGTLEWRAIAIAQAALSGDMAQKAMIRRFALGPELGQCCGGEMHLLFEVLGADGLPWVRELAEREKQGRFATRGTLSDGGVDRVVLAEAVMPETATFEGGVITECFGDDPRSLYLFGAGHVGRALIFALAPLPFAVRWIDPRPDAFPGFVPGNVTTAADADPATALREALPGSFVLAMTHSHALDLAVVHTALADPRFAYVGVIGSKTKRVRFTRRLTEAGIAADRIAGLVCPIGIAGIRSKAPAVIAAATAAELILRDEAVRAAALSTGLAVDARPHGSEGRVRPSGVPTLEAVKITKDFATIRANDAIDFVIHPGEVHALLGENGAGKSTLVKILYGALQPTSGEIRWKGKPVTIASPAAARRLGIGMVFQHFSLFDALTVAENIALALDGAHNFADLKTKVAAVSREYGLPLNPDSTVADLSVGERQRVEIVRCLLQQPELIIMDEPTSVLTPQEADQLFVTLNRLVSEGRSVLYISHRLEEVRALCHHATILRRGKVVGECDPQRESAARLAAMMVGAEVRQLTAPEPAGEGARVRLSVNHLSMPAPHPFAVALDDVSLDVRSGEVVSIAGVAGNGQDELFDALSGEAPATISGAVVIDGHEIGRQGITARRRLDAAFVPEQRLGHAAVPRFSLSHNVVLTRHGTGDGLVRTGVLSFGGARAIVGRVTELFDVRKGSADPEAMSLSGGNLQKFVVGREFDRRPRVLVVCQPTWGVDAGAAMTIRQALIDLARAGSAVLVISQDLDEILEISDRVAVISKGRLSPPHDAHGITREEIGLLMGGGKH